jgi:hypothetical protein
MVVRDGRSIYLGRWDTHESRAVYERVIAAWLAQRRLTGP